VPHVPYPCTLVVDLPEVPQRGMRPAILAPGGGCKISPLNWLRCKPVTLTGGVLRHTRHLDADRAQSGFKATLAILALALVLVPGVAGCSTGNCSGSKCFDLSRSATSSLDGVINPNDIVVKIGVDLTKESYIDQACQDFSEDSSPDDVSPGVCEVALGALSDAVLDSGISELHAAASANECFSLIINANSSAFISWGGENSPPCMN
jgi:hypothetical protein